MRYVQEDLALHLFVGKFLEKVTSATTSGVLTVEDSLVAVVVGLFHLLANCGRDVGNLCFSTFLEVIDC